MSNKIYGSQFKTSLEEQRRVIRFCSFETVIAYTHQIVGYLIAQCDLKELFDHPLHNQDLVEATTPFDSPIESLARDIALGGQHKTSGATNYIYQYLFLGDILRCKNTTKNI